MSSVPPDGESVPRKVAWSLKIGEKLGGYKDQVSTVQSLVTILAVLIGGIWTYKLFISERQGHPHLKVEHRIEHWKISEDLVLLSVDEILTNSGPVLLKLRGGEIRVIQVVPLPATVQKDLPDVQKLHDGAEPSIEDPSVWTVIAHGKRDWKEEDVVIEPGESDVVNNEFVVPGNLRVVAVYSYISNPDETKNDLGWNALTFYNLETSTTSKARARKSPE